ncbi:hypothetical protein N7492_001415 [Penicillium capsulatum]|uniref:F-box domain-containing protein n=1 Tax=Penicillium capsulatum TaxID=69766 RepID=A0A9W9ITL7_9EURO|nr:hypothetical protein N7492_001415 [Penicillium capsulatum]KAJ6129529.1 hypothetical protein N7512_002309 [Penicillium capsulatum]
MDNPSPLEIPEIVANVLRFAENHTLFAAAQVNSLWADEATNWLWRGQYRKCIDSFSRPLQKLSRCCQDRERLDWYTKKIRILDLYNDDEDEPSSITTLVHNKHFTFPNLKSVVIDLGSENMPESVMAQFLCPTLLSLEVYGGYYTSWFLDQIKANAPGLRFFLMDNRITVKNAPEAIRRTGFMPFLQNMPSISHLELHHGWKPIFDKVFWDHITRRPNLEYLSLCPDEEIQWSTLCPPGLDGRLGGLFPALRYLSMTTNPQTLQLLLPKLPALQGVSLDVESHPICRDIESNGLASLSSCPLLEEIEFLGQELITSSDLLTLALRCPRLRILDVQAPMVNDRITEEQFNTMVSRWKNLSVLSLTCSVDLSVASFANLAHLCPNLHNLDLFCCVDLNGLASYPDTMVFPSLRGLRLDVPLPMPEPQMSETWMRSWVRDQFDLRFPALQTFDVGFRGNLDGNLGRLMTEIGGEFLKGRPDDMSRPFNIRSMYIERLLEPVSGSGLNSKF